VRLGRDELGRPEHRRRDGDTPLIPSYAPSSGPVAVPSSNHRPWIWEANVLASIPSATVLGASGQPVTVEVHVASGLPSYRLVGMPDATCRESRDRVRAAVMSSGLQWPQKCITVNLAPSAPRKVGAGLDLAIAIGVLVASGVVAPDAVAGHGFVGELGLDGTLRRVAGTAPMVAVLGDVTTVVPAGCRAEAVCAAAGEVRVASTLAEVVAALTTHEPWPEIHDDPGHADPPPLPDLADVRGQPVARQALEIAAAGGHHLLMVGAPGSGKTMLAQRLTGLLPPLGRSDALAATMIHSAAGAALPPGGLVISPPFRAPHHTSSVVALVGGGSSTLRPGEISLAHGGVLFLDELGEFAPSALDALREPLEEGVIRVARAAVRAVLPARFQLVAATNPCPCGGAAPGSCECDDVGRLRYLRRLSGPLLDRFDLRVAVQRPRVDELLDPGGGEPTAAVAARVVRARRIATARARRLNAELRGEVLDQVAPLTAAAKELLRSEIERDRLTGRGYHRIRRVARTIADLRADDAGSAADVLDVEHVSIALSLRTRLRAASPGLVA
jgi:magnesium chelatase family protein